MANISISDLSPAGSDLFIDFDSFLRELNDNEFPEIAGGIMTPELPYESYTITYTPPSFL